MFNIQTSLELFRNLSATAAFFMILMLNIIQFTLSLLLGTAIRKRCKPIYSHETKTSRRELNIASLTVFLNSLVTMLGWWAWHVGLYIPSSKFGLNPFLDFLLLTIAMDLLMFCFHRVAHFEPLFSWIHQLHHQFAMPSPISLFVLSPFETLGFGVIWTIVVLAVQPSLNGIFIFLFINILWGTLGHCGSEIFPEWWTKVFPTKYIANSSFHANHHLNPSVNYGFYTNIWDRLLKLIIK